MQRPTRSVRVLGKFDCLQCFGMAWPRWQGGCQETVSAACVLVSAAAVVAAPEGHAGGHGWRTDPELVQWLRNRCGRESVCASPRTALQYISSQTSIGGHFTAQSLQPRGQMMLQCAEPQRWCCHAAKGCMLGLLLATCCRLSPARLHHISSRAQHSLRPYSVLECDADTLPPRRD
jgi:hypothetical protein